MDIPDCIKNIANIPPEPSWIARTGEPLSLQALLGHFRGFTVYHETLAPGHRSASPHSHSRKDEFIFVLTGNPDVWLDGNLHRLQPGDAISFQAGTGVAHTFVNNSNQAANYLVVSSNGVDDDVVSYSRLS